MVSTAHLVVSIGLWFAGSVVNNIWTKKMLNGGFPLPLTASVMGMMAQLFALTIVSLAKGNPGKEKAKATTKELVPISVCQISGNTLHKVALMYTAIPVVHTVKSLNSVITAILGYAFYGTRAPSLVSLVLIVVGVGTAVSNTNAAFFNRGDADAIGVAAALLCTCTDASRAVFGKSVIAPNPTQNLIKLQKTSLMIFIPLAMYVESSSIAEIVASPEAFSSLPFLAIFLSVVGVAWMELSNFYNLTILSPLTHSMTNAIRSLVVIGAGIVVGSPVRAQFILGCAISLIGVSLHSYYGKRVPTAPSATKKAS
eukprot:TRINITY_DN9861_c0_g1_i1.p1 TRINITY_DN9861_c0_g1~~TRINITY_DN9861_c0_g1_i1.p1  ORF type:complete len:353 (+),score=46.79 TRINITY_DN9861_c0_g1_i1:126-1061(+)